jgi:hypothetical protein
MVYSAVLELYMLHDGMQEIIAYADGEGIFLKSSPKVIIVLSSYN